jgi:hypothetical protein
VAEETKEGAQTFDGEACFVNGGMRIVGQAVELRGGGGGEEVREAARFMSERGPGLELEFRSWRDCGSVGD